MATTDTRIGNDGGTTNTDVTDAMEAGLTPDQLSAARSYLVGWVENIIAEDEWRKATRHARDFAESIQKVS